MIATPLLTARPLIIAHRGGKTGLAENTLPAFAWAIEIGADMIEFDVRKTHDQVLIVFHDETLNGQAIDTLSYDELIAQRDIPTLKQVLQLTQGKIKLDVELKETDYEADVLSLVLSYFRSSEFIVTSFNSSSITTLKTLYPEVKLGLLLEGSEINWELVQTTDPDILLPEWPLLNALVKAKSKELNLPLIPWTINDPHRIREFLEWDEILGVITDSPEVALRIRNEGSRLD